MGSEIRVFQPKYTYTDPATGAKETRTSEKWWYDFTICGKRIRESADTTRKTIAASIAKNRRMELERALAGLPIEPAQKRIHSVDELVDRYLANYGINHRQQSILSANNRLAHIKEWLGSRLLPELTEDRIMEYIKVRLAEKASGRTINMELGELSRALGHTWKELWPKVRKLEENHDIGKALSPEEETRLLAAANSDESPNRNPAVWPFLNIALATAMRSGEIAKLRWSNVDLDSSIIMVGKKAKTKAGSGREIPINADLRAVFDEHAAWYLRKLGEIKPDYYVFPGRAGRPADGRDRPLDPLRPIGDITTAWDTLRERCRVRCRLHDLRHTALTKMAESGVPESTMLAIAGHMSRAMLEHYSHVRMAAKREAVKALTLPNVGPRPVPKPAKEKPRMVAVITENVG